MKLKKLWWCLLIPALLICIYGIIALWPDQNNSYLTAEHRVEDDPDAVIEHVDGWEAVPDASDSDVIPTLSAHVLFVEKRSGMQLTLTGNENGVVTFTLAGMDNDNFDSSFIKCVSDGNYLSGKNAIISAEQPIASDLSVTVREEDNRTYTAVITVTETKDYTWQLKEDSHYFFMEAVE